MRALSFKSDYTFAKGGSMEENERKTDRFLKILKWSTAVLVLILIAGVIVLAKNVSVETLLSYTPSNKILAAFLIVLLYGIKSVTVFFPLVVLEALSGHLFSTGVAILVNLAGLVTALTVPYFIGKHMGIGIIRIICEKYPKFEEFLSLQQDNVNFLCYLSRAVGCLPGDIVTMYFGATGTSYIANVVGGCLGILPPMILATVFGSSIQDPGSPVFILSIVLCICLSVFSTVGYWLYRRKKKIISSDK